MPRMKQRRLYARVNRKLDKWLAVDYQRQRMKNEHHLSQTYGTYIGVRRRLKGKTAIVILYPWGVMAQFDDYTLPEGFWWHHFPLKDWILE
jgi:hypothetical protein